MRCTQQLTCRLRASETGQSEPTGERTGRLLQFAVAALQPMRNRQAVCLLGAAAAATLDFVSDEFRQDATH